MWLKKRFEYFSAYLNLCIFNLAVNKVNLIYASLTAKAQNYRNRDTKFSKI